MSDSGLKEPSATKNIDLKARLEEMRSQHASQIQKIEKELLESFENDLNGLFCAEKSAIANGLSSLNATFSEQTEQLRKRVIAETGRMFWMLKLPLLSTAITCLTMIALCLLWFQSQNRERARMSRWQDGGRTYLIVDDPSWQLCRMGTLDKSKTLKTTTVILQPCKPLE